MTCCHCGGSYKNLHCADCCRVIVEAAHSYKTIGCSGCGLALDTHGPNCPAKKGENMTRHTNGRDIEVRKVENGYFVTGTWNSVPKEILAPTFRDVVEILWMNYEGADRVVGEDPWDQIVRDLAAP